MGLLLRQTAPPLAEQSALWRSNRVQTGAALIAVSSAAVRGAGRSQRSSSTASPTSGASPARATPVVYDPVALTDSPTPAWSTYIDSQQMQPSEPVNFPWCRVVNSWLNE